MSDFTYVPAPGSQLRKAPRVRNAQFGDGYLQRLQDGINANPDVWDLVFNRTEADCDAIEVLLNGYAGTEAFTWTPPGNKDEITVICQEWRRAYPTSIVKGSITATFVQVFDIGSTPSAALDPGTIAEDSHTDTTANLSVAVPASGGTAPRSRQWRHDIGAGMVDIGGETGTTLADTGLPDDTDIDYELETTDDVGAVVTTPVVTVHTDAASASTPLTIFGADLVAWYDKDVPGTAGSWTDQSGNANHLLQPTAGNRPTIGGDGTRTGDATDDVMAASFTLNQVCTIFGRIKLNTWAATKTIWDGTTNDTASLQTAVGSPQVATFAGGGAVSSTRNATVGSYVSIIAQYGSATGSYLDIGGSEVTGVDIGSTNAGGLALFARPDASRSTDMTAAAFGAVNRAITSGEKTALLAYLTGLI